MEDDAFFSCLYICQHVEEPAKTSFSHQSLNEIIASCKICAALSKTKHQPTPLAEKMSEWLGKKARIRSEKSPWV